MMNDPKEVYQTAKSVLECAASWESEACLLGNVKASEIAEMCKYLMSHIEGVDPMVIFDGVPFRFWVCPNDCRDIVEWSEDGIATCKSCNCTSEN